MARREKSDSTVRRAKSAISRTAKKLTSKLRPRRRISKQTEEPVVARASTRTTPKVKSNRAEPQSTARPAKRQTDIPLDAISGAYTPKQTSLKTSFRATGAEHQRDQDVPGEHWNDEDHYTNRSGDPRIGTHGRAYEPGERKRGE
jgi:hypothetical protein